MTASVPAEPRVMTQSPTEKASARFPCRSAAKRNTASVMSRDTRGMRRFAVWVMRSAVPYSAGVR